MSTEKITVSQLAGHVVQPGVRVVQRSLRMGFVKDFQEEITGVRVRVSR